MTEDKKFTIEEILLKEGKYIGPTVGVSMLPMLKNRRDTIVVLPKTERLKPYDVALYKRGNDYVLHRVLAPLEDGYLIRGDNCYNDEHVKEECVIGVLSEFFQKNKHILCTDKKYIAYAKRRVKSYPIRRFFVLLFVKIKNIAKKILKFLKLRK